MTVRLAFALACAVCGTGCVSRPLQRNTLQQVGTLSDIYQQQVLDNLALFCVNPDAVPSFAVPGAGTVAVENSVEGGGSVQFTRGGLDGYGFSAGGSRLVTGNWSLAPINDPDKLRLMRCMFRHVVGHPPAVDCDPCREALELRFGPDWATCAAPSGWLCVGCRKDVPKDACAVGHYRGTHVWVKAEGREALARLTLSTLDVATVAFVHPPPASKEVTTYHYERDVLMREEKRVVVDPATGPRRQQFGEKDLQGLKAVKPEDLPAAGRPIERLNFYDPYRGLFSLPR